MIRDYCKFYNDLERLKKQLEHAIPSVMSGFNSLHVASTSDGALTTKTKELIALGIAITMKCSGSIAFHVKDALKAGASSPEILETISVAILMGGDPSVVYGCEALEALNQYIVLEE